MKMLRDVAGYQTNCFYFEPCPICFGCRVAYKYCSSRCDSRCSRNAKFNICSSPLHYPANFEKIISRPRIEINTIKEEGKKDGSD